MGAVFFKSGNDKSFEKEIAKYSSLNEVPVTTIEGQVTTIGNLVTDKCLYLIINTASK